MSGETLQLGRCSDCSRLRWPVTPACPACFSTSYELVPSTGDGSLWTYTVAYRTLPRYQDEAPFAVGILELDDEPEIRVLGRIVDCPVDDVRIGMPLRVRPPTESGGRYEFHPVGS